MKQQKFLGDCKKIADIQAQRVEAALNRVKEISPLDSAKLESLCDEELAFLDMAVTRFSKLLDTIGTKIFPLVLKSLSEDKPGDVDTSFIDKLNILEKLGLIPEAEWWIKMGEIRNQVTHDYPDDYKILSAHLNELIILAEELLKFWQNFKTKF